ncbi:NmrA/HSCARG family protein [Bradyrhizobium xenonodulans]|uniref:NmrA/HSCARG family protein n=1 Tax=Bradyrhizobium xenonodulans TaxID=2736875 RepID=A0ABY7MWW6_9BRAD|nr:NmrA/HSCARG family protein [Bradyrhizobium xenonodulans]WBL81077.1 NmrA/HSCARG family protein [Bradyrhizobium xenonodulans]
MGATGAQGGGLARAILNNPDGPFQLRALTRKTGSDKATELARLGAEVVETDIDDLRSLNRAFEGAHGAFCITNFGEYYSPERELAQAAQMAEAAKEAGLSHVIWSTLEDTRKFVALSDDRLPTLMGKYKLPQADGKGEADREFIVREVPTTFLLTSFYWENFIHHGLGPKRGPDGVLNLAIPMGNRKLPGIAVEDIGKCAYGIFERGSEYIGKTVGVAGGHLTGEEMAAAFATVGGEDVRYSAVPIEAYRNAGFPGADIMANTFQFQHDFNEHYCAARSIGESRALNPALLSFERWLALNKKRIPIEPRQADA